MFHEKLQQERGKVTDKADLTAPEGALAIQTAERKMCSRARGHRRQQPDFVTQSRAAIVLQIILAEKEAVRHDLCQAIDSSLFRQVAELIEGIERVGVFQILPQSAVAYFFSSQPVVQQNGGLIRIETHDQEGPKRHSRFKNRAIGRKEPL